MNNQRARLITIIFLIIPSLAAAIGLLALDIWAYFFCPLSTLHDPTPLRIAWPLGPTTVGESICTLAFGTPIVLILAALIFYRSLPKSDED